jgi:group I intron endonuclease
MKGVIYCYHCIPTGKKYIGQTLYETRRKAHHLFKSKDGDTKFYCAIRKYGWEKFIYGVISKFDVDLLNEMETFYIQSYDTFKSGYNSTLGGDGNYGYKLTEETKKKISIKNKGRKLNEEHKAKIGKASKGRKFSKDIVEKRNNTRRKNNPEWHSKQAREKMSLVMKKHSGENNPRYGKKHTEETKQKISESVKNSQNNNKGKKWWNNGQNNKISVECPGNDWVLGMCKKK